MEKSTFIFKEGNAPSELPTIKLSIIPNGTAFRGKVGSSGPNDTFLKTIGSDNKSIVIRLISGDDMSNRWTDTDYMVLNFRVVDLTITVIEKK